MRTRNAYLAVGATVVGVAVIAGAVLAVSGAVSAVDEASPSVVSVSAVFTYDCPDGDSSSQLRRGDRILLTAQSEDGVWVQLRDPVDLSRRVWLRREAVTVDEPSRPLPVAVCEGELPATTSSSTPEEPPSTDSETSSSTIEPDSTPTTPTSEVVTDSSGPVISTLAVNPSTIYEWNFGSTGTESCNLDDAFPVRSSVVVAASDPAGIASVDISWSIGDESGALAVTGAGPYFAELGPFGEGILTTASGTIKITVTATDAVGNQSTKTTTAKLQDCVFG